MNLADIKARIIDQCPGIKKTGYLTDLTQIETTADDTPSVFYFWSDDDTASADGIGALNNQAVTMTLSFLVIAKVPDGDVDHLQNVRASLFAALNGWETNNEKLLFSGGSVESISGSLIRWRDNFQFTRYLRNIR